MRPKRSPSSTAPIATSSEIARHENWASSLASNPSAAHVGPAIPPGTLLLVLLRQQTHPNDLGARSDSCCTTTPGLPKVCAGAVLFTPKDGSGPRKHREKTRAASRGGPYDGNTVSKG